MTQTDWGLVHLIFMFSVTTLGLAGGLIYLATKIVSGSWTFITFYLTIIGLVCVGYWAMNIAYNHGWLQPLI
jgi:phosphoglycerol transferase MdoB-like AlkP superfamily enzyme